jgi:hypothetical protein
VLQATLILAANNHILPHSSLLLGGGSGRKKNLIELLFVAFKIRQLQQLEDTLTKCCDGERRELSFPWRLIGPKTSPVCPSSSWSFLGNPTNLLLHCSSNQRVSWWVA